LIGCMGLAAFVAGKLLSAGGGRDFYQLFFYPKIFAAYVVFGLGAAALVFVGWLVWWALIAVNRRIFWQRIFYGAGALGFLPILAFYSMQMFSTRHWVTALAALAAVLLARRSGAVLGARSWSVGISAIVLFAAIMPLFVGINLPYSNAPRLVLGAGTAFPTTDGLITMGGYMPRLWEMRTGGFRHDHNQAVWEAARDADYDVGPDGSVPFLYTPMWAYYELACTLRGLESRKAAEQEPVHYLDSRSALRFSPLLGSGTGDQPTGLLLRRQTEVVSEIFDGISMLRNGNGFPDPQFVRLAGISLLLGGNEFRLLEVPLAVLEPRWQGHGLLLVSENPLPDGGVGQRVTFTPPEGGQVLYGVRFRAREVVPSLRHWLELCQKAGVQAAVTALPEYMAVETL
jgi:hypothetical protein